MSQRQLLSFTFAALLLMVSAQFSFAQTIPAKAATLKTQTLSDGRFSIDLPGEPELETETEQDITTKTYTYEDEDNLFSVVEMTSPGMEKLLAESTDMAKTMSESFFGGLLAEANKNNEVKGSMKDVKAITHNGMEGNELDLTISGFPVKARLLVGKDAIFMFTVFDGAVLEKELRDKVLNSFKFNEPKRTAK